MQSRLVLPQSPYPMSVFTLKYGFRKKQDANTVSLYTVALRDLRSSFLFMFPHQLPPLHTFQKFRNKSKLEKKCDLTYLAFLVHSNNSTIDFRHKGSSKDMPALVPFKDQGLFTMSIPLAKDNFSGADCHNTIIRITGSLPFRAFTG